MVYGFNSTRNGLIYSILNSVETIKNTSASQNISQKYEQKYKIYDNILPFCILPIEVQFLVLFQRKREGERWRYEVYWQMDCIKVIIFESDKESYIKEIPDSPTFTPVLGNAVAVKDIW